MFGETGVSGFSGFPLGGEGCLITGTFPLGGDDALVFGTFPLGGDDVLVFGGDLFCCITFL